MRWALALLFAAQAFAEPPAMKRMRVADEEEATVFVYAYPYRWTLDSDNVGDTLVIYIDSEDGDVLVDLYVFDTPRADPEELLWTMEERYASNFSFGEPTAESGGGLTTVVERSGDGATLSAFVHDDVALVLFATHPEGDERGAETVEAMLRSVEGAE